MRVANVILPILRLVNNFNRRNEVINWINTVLNEIGAYARWGFLLKEVVAFVSGDRVELPSDWNEIRKNVGVVRWGKPICHVYTVYHTGNNIVLRGYSNVNTVIRFNNTDYNVAKGFFNLSVGNVSNAGVYSVTGEYVYSYDQVNVDPLRNNVYYDKWSLRRGLCGSDCYKLVEAYIDGGLLCFKESLEDFVLFDYYRKIRLVNDEESTIDLPDEFVYNLITYGAARVGLMQEDDFQRLQYCEQKYQEYLSLMRVWDARRNIADGVVRLKSRSIYEI